MAYKIHITKKYIRKRQISPTKFDPRSFRIKEVSTKTKIIIGCPKGKYEPTIERCKVGTKVQSILKKRKK